jgi:hypothetical protein
MRIVFALCARLKVEGSMAAAASPVPTKVLRLISNVSSLAHNLNGAQSVGDAREVSRPHR